MKLTEWARREKDWSDSRKRRRKGRRVGFPRFRKKGRCRESVRFTTGALRVDDKSHVVLPRIGRVRTHESTAALLARIEAGKARILAATVSREGGRWFVSFTCEAERVVGRPRCPDTVVGVDAGLRDVAVLSTGERVPAPRPLRRASRRIARLNRELARRQPGSRNREGTVVVERLNVAGIVRNRRLARAVLDAGLAELRRQLGYKCPWNGSRLIEADVFYPSSKLCSRCGAVRADLPLRQRTFRCEACGLEIDRDENAALNLAALVAAVAGSGPESAACKRFGPAGAGPAAVIA